MLVNLSNQPASSWSQEQWDAADSLASYVLDVPFPKIDPNASLEDIARFAQDIFESIKDDAGFVYIEGEMTFVYSFVKICEAAGIRCFAATFEPVVVKNPDGSETSVFKFIQFRPYF
jgi:hypothetical protein